jgi:hypothetical protein
MIARIAFLLLLVTSGCAVKEVLEPCGAPSKIWVNSDEFKWQDNYIFHKIEVTHMNQTLVNGVPKDEAEVGKFLRDLKDNEWDALFFDFDAHADCQIVQSFRKIIERSKFCTHKNCVYGNADIQPPEYNPERRKPS